MNKEFLLERGEKNVDTFGETPLTTMDVISQECGIKSSDIFYELGSGRARTCFWLHAFIGCRVYGVEYLPAFVKIAQSDTSGTVGDSKSSLRVPVDPIG